MYTMLSTIGVLFAMFASVFALPSNLETRKSSSTFSLFAYGSMYHSEIGGFPIFYYEGYAYIANPNKVNYTENYVVFSEGTTDTTEWVADAKMGTDMTWAGSLFYAPTPAGHTGFYKEGISNVSTSDIVTSGFTFYGMTAMLKINSKLYTEWYAVPTQIDGLWSVSWNTTDTFDTSEAEPITVRKVYPPNVDYPDV